MKTRRGELLEEVRIRLAAASVEQLDRLRGARTRAELLELLLDVAAEVAARPPRDAADLERLRRLVVHHRHHRA